MTEPSMLRGRDIICFSSIDWQFIWQGHQEIMSTLAANGNRVLFVENTGVRAPSLSDLPRLWQRVSNWWRSTNGFRPERENLYIYSPLILPFPYSSLVRSINRRLVVRALERWMRAAGFGPPLIWTFLPTPLVREVIRDLEPLLTVYYCIDDFSSSSKSARRITESEQQLFREVDLVFVTSEKLRQRAAGFSEHVHLFPFGVSLKKFDRIRMAEDQIPPDLSAFKRPIVGYVGGIHRWIDIPLLARVAAAMPDASFVLVGPLQTDVSAVEKLPNVHFMGMRSHDDVPRYIKGFDVGIVPYSLSEYTANVYPTKLNEYLSMGIPVVSTDLPEIRRFNADHGPNVAIASTADQFADAVRDALRPSTREERDRRLAIAQKNSWQARIEEMSVLIEDRLDRAREQRRPWEARLRHIYRRARGRALATVFLIVLLYMGLFNSSVPWWVAEPLRVSGAPVPSEAIVVFAGGVGESGEAGGGYQERVKRAVDLYNSGFAPLLIFESGYVFAFREAEIMRDLAISLGVPGERIAIETTAANTYEDVVRVRDMLAQRHIRRILLVSSPYHMRRALLVWKKQAPEISVTPTPVEDTQFYAHGRGATVEQLRGLVHEYIAIAWYWWQGWL